MSCSVGPGIVKSGLDMHIDMANTKKSWKGATTTNLYGSIDNGNLRPISGTHYWDGNNWLVSATYTNPGISGPSGVYLGKVYTFKSGSLNSTWSGNSYGYMLKTLTPTNGQYYQVSAYVYISNDCNIDDIRCSTEAATNNNVAISGYNQIANLTTLKGTWQRISASCVAGASNINFIPWYPAKYGVIDGSFTGFFMCAMPMVEILTYPSYPTESVRTDIQSVNDLTKKNTLTASSLTYASDNKFSFNNTAGQKINTGYAALLTDFTVAVWFKSTGNGGGYDRLIDKQYTTGMMLMRNAGLANSWGGGVIEPNPPYGIFLTLSDNQWHYLVSIRSGTTHTLYGDGITNTVSNTVSASALTGQTLTIGNWATADQQRFIGSVGAVKIYNRALSAAEVLQNFEATRDRYGI